MRSSSSTLGRAGFLARESNAGLPVHQSNPISSALSTEHMRTRISRVSNSTSTKRMRISPLMTTPLSSKRSNKSATVVESVEWVNFFCRSLRKSLQYQPEGLKTTNTLLRRIAKERE